MLQLGDVVHDGLRRSSMTVCITCGCILVVPLVKSSIRIHIVIHLGTDGHLLDILLIHWFTVKRRRRRCSLGIIESTLTGWSRMRILEGAIFFCIQSPRPELHGPLMACRPIVCTEQAQIATWCYATVGIVQISVRATIEFFLIVARLFTMESGRATNRFGDRDNAYVTLDGMVPA